MKLLLLFILISSTSLSSGSQQNSRNQEFMQPFIPNSTLKMYQTVDLYGSINNDSINTQSFSIEPSSIFQYPEDFDPNYYVKNKDYRHSKKEICCCICSGISSSTILAFIGYLIFH